MSAEENQYNHLEELNGSNYQIVEGEPDITGWDVIDQQGRKIGDVDDVLFDPQTREVRYIIVDLEDNELDIDNDKKVLVPIGIAELRGEYDEDSTETDTITEIDRTEDNIDDEQDDDTSDEEVVYLPTVTAEQLLALPGYEKGNLSPENETTIRNVFEPPVADTVVLYQPDTFYTHDHFNNKIYPKRNSQVSDELDRNDLDSDRDDDNINRDRSAF